MKFIRKQKTKIVEKGGEKFKVEYGMMVDDTAFLTIFAFGFLMVFLMGALMIKSVLAISILTILLIICIANMIYMFYRRNEVITKLSKKQLRDEQIDNLIG